MKSITLRGAEGYDGIIAEDETGKKTYMLYVDEMVMTFEGQSIRWWLQTHEWRQPSPIQGFRKRLEHAWHLMRFGYLDMRPKP